MRLSQQNLCVISDGISGGSTHETKIISSSSLFIRSARPLTVSNRAEPLALTHSGKAAAPSDSDSKSFELLGAWTLN